MLLLQANGIVKDFAERRVLDSVDMSIYDGDRIGLVGENGAGKSTLMGILAGRSEPDEGRVEARCPLALVEQFGQGEDAGEYGAGEVASRFAAQELHEGLSGGECTRRRIAAALSRAPRLMMLDEPTTDLDAQGVEQLRKELEVYPGAMVLVSHDRGLLDALCTRIWHLEDGKLTDFPGNYTEYRAELERRRAFQQFEYDQYRGEQARLRADVSEVKADLRSLMLKPGGRWDALVEKGLLCVLSAVIAAVLARIS